MFGLPGDEARRAGRESRRPFASGGRGMRSGPRADGYRLRSRRRWADRSAGAGACGAASRSRGSPLGDEAISGCVPTGERVIGDGVGGLRGATALRGGGAAAGETAASRDREGGCGFGAVSPAGGVSARPARYGGRRPGSPRRSAGHPAGADAVPLRGAGGLVVDEAISERVPTGERVIGGPDRWSSGGDGAPRRRRGCGRNGGVPRPGRRLRVRRGFAGGWRQRAAGPLRRAPSGEPAPVRRASGRGGRGAAAWSGGPGGRRSDLRARPDRRAGDRWTGSVVFGARRRSAAEARRWAERRRPAAGKAESGSAQFPP